MSWILTYLMVGVTFLFLYEIICDYIETEFRFTNKERLIVGLLWPIAIIMFIWTFIKTILNDSN